MQRIIEYGLGLLVLMLLQIFIFDNINIAGYVNAYIYIMFIILLPMQMNASVVMLIGFASGLIMDFLTGSAGLCALVATWIAFIRPSLLLLTAGRDVVNVGGMPSSKTIGAIRFLTYVLLMTTAYNVPFFLLETMNLSEINYTTLRITFSTIFTTAAIYLSHLLLLRRA